MSANYQASASAPEANAEYFSKLSLILGHNTQECVHSEEVGRLHTRDSARN